MPAAERLVWLKATGVSYATIPLRYDIEYPESDGQPLGETDFHRDEILDLIAELKDRFREAADVYVAGNLFLYHVEGDRRAVVCPDVFLVKGVSKHKRRTYKLWEEGRSPSFVIEVTSLHTRDEDLQDKKRLYERPGIEEYFLHDPFGEYLAPILQGFRLVEGRYRPLSPSPDGSLISNTTGLRLRPEGQRLRLINLATGEPLLWDEEVREQARRAAQAEDALRAAEEELARFGGSLKAVGWADQWVPGPSTQMGCSLFNDGRGAPPPESLEETRVKIRLSALDCAYFAKCSISDLARFCKVLPAGARLAMSNCTQVRGS